MSLNWNAEKLPEEIRTYYWTDSKGQKHSQQCPKMHRFIWLTMSINRNMTGGPKAKAEFIKRFKAISIISPVLVEIEMHKSNMDEHPEFWNGAKAVSKDVMLYTLTVEDVERYWGLETNVWGREAYSKWLVRMVQIATDRRW